MARSHNGGFTVIEVLVALTLLAVAVELGAHAFLVVLEVAARSARATVATALASAVLEEVRSGIEAQDAATRAARFDALASRGPAPFSPPFDRYAWELVLDRVTVTPPWAWPCWARAAPPPPCDGRAGADAVRWITVRVMHGGRLASQITSGTIRGMNDR
jgi:prepilin-type N-terminal cleavage/methylation domain-containing protein